MAEQPIKVIDENPTVEPQVVPAENRSEFLAGKTLRFYFRLAVFPALIAAFISIIFILFRTNPTINSYWDWLLRLAVFFFQIVTLVIWLSYLHQNKIVTNYQAVVLGAITGLIIGLLVATFRLVYWHRFWQFFNLFFEPLYTLIGGGLVAVILNSLKKRSN